MAYKKEDIIKQSIKVIKEHDLIYISEIFAYTPFDKTTFYRHKCNECNDIIKEIHNTKINIKQELRKKWRSSKSPYLQQLLYKLCANDDELSRIRTLEKKDESQSSEYESIDFEYTEYQKN